MSDSDRKVRVFISSTFRDMHTERDHLVTVVFPELRERCERLGLEFFDVDLRWGVPEKGVDGESANSWEYCRKWINEARPFFICLLGQRYGWEPEPHQLKDESIQQAQAADRRSITDMEVHHALENDAHSRRCYFYLRQGQAPATATEFVDPPPLLVKLDALKARVETCGRPVWHYPCRWTGSGFTDMEAFGKKVLEDLWSGILRDPRYVSEEAWQQVLGTDPAKDSRYTDESQPVPEDLAVKLILLAKPPPKDRLEAEREQMAAFADSRVRWFQGRTKEIDDLIGFIHDPAEDNAPRLAVIAAVPGQGKSAVMAKLWEALLPKEPKKDKNDSASPSLPISESPSLFIISHFVGATEKSSTAYHLVRRLIDELDASGIPFPETPQSEGQSREDQKLDFNSLCQRLYERLGDYAGERRMVILLDALNQLDDGHDLGWLPHRLGTGVRIVVSCIDDPSSQDDSPERKVLTALQARFPKPKFVPLGGLDVGDVRTIVEGYLLEYCKQLDAPHVDAICAMSQARNPLYLLVMLAELRTLGGNDMNKIVPDLIAEMAAKYPDTVSLYTWVLQRMESADGFGKEAVKWWCLYLFLGRVGMASSELADLLARKLGPEGSATALRVERGLRRYLQRRGETLDFFHDQLRQAVTESYGDKADVLKGHGEIAVYLRSLTDPANDQSWKGESQRAFNEMAPHLIGAEQWDDLCAYLTDCLCLDRRIQAGQAFEVVRAHSAALAALPEFAEEARRERERIEASEGYGAALTAYAQDCAQGKHPTLPKPPAAELSQRFIRARNTTIIRRLFDQIVSSFSPKMPRPESAAKRLGENQSLRAMRLRVFATFCAQHGTFLAENPQYFLPLAANAAEDGPLCDAFLTLASDSRTWLHLSPRPPAPPLRPQCLAILLGHTKAVKSVSVTPDGRRAVSGGGDQTLRVWDLDSGQCLATLKGHASMVRCVSITPDGRRAVSASWDQTLRVWDLDNGLCLATLQGHSSMVFSVSVTPDGRRAVSGGNDQTLRLWNLDSGQCLAALQGHSSAILGVRISPDGRRAVSCSSDHTLQVWDLKNKRRLAILKGHAEAVLAVSVTPDWRHAVSGSNDGTLRVWDLLKFQCLTTLQGSAGNNVDVTPDGSVGISSGVGDFIKVWDLHDGQMLAEVEGHSESINSLALTASGSRAISASDDHTLKVWDLESGQRGGRREERGGFFMDSVLTPDRLRAVFVASDHSLRVWDVDIGQCVALLRGHTELINCVSVTPDSRRAVSGSSDNSARVWDLHGGRCLAVLKGHVGQIYHVIVTPDGRHVVSGSADATLRVWDLESGQCHAILQGHTGRICALSAAPSGRRVVSASGDQTVRIWDLESCECVAILKGHTSLVDAVKISPDGRRVVSAATDRNSIDHSLRVWDMESGQCLATFRGHTQPIRSVTITPDGQRIISSSLDRSIRVWNLDTGNCQISLEPFGKVVAMEMDGRVLGDPLEYALTPDGRTLVFGAGKSLRVLDLHQNVCKAVLYGHDESIYETSISPNGNLVVSSSWDRTVRVWDLFNGRCLAVYHTRGMFDKVTFATNDHIVCVSSHSRERMNIYGLTLKNLPRLEGELIEDVTIELRRLIQRL